MKQPVYLDNAATTKISKAALDAMMPYLTDGYGNPSSIYSIGRQAKEAIENARVKTAEAIGAKPEEIYFTGSGTESINWAIKATALKNKDKGSLPGKPGRPHVITSAIEHHAVLHSADYLEKNGFEVTRLTVDRYGQISLDELRSAINERTVLISIMTANNEIGTIEPVAGIAEIAKEKGVTFHTDATQAVGHIPIDVKKINADMMSFSGHKFGGAKGTGVLYSNKPLSMPSFVHGGDQERGKRAGTENVAGIVSLAAALEDALTHLPLQKTAKMRDKLIDGLLKIPRSHLTGDPLNRLPGIASFVFECIEGESMLLMLDREGICASSGSACTSGSLDPSHVLLAAGLPHETAHGSLRLSLSVNNTDEEIDYVLEKLPGIVARLRSMSPLWKD